jgi:putative endonuclease
MALAEPISADVAAPCYVYILGSFGKGGYRTYVGWTYDVDRRLLQHNNGTGARSTRGRTWIVLYVELHATRSEAMSREWHLKRDRRFRGQFKLSASEQPGRMRSAPPASPGPA